MNDPLIRKFCETRYRWLIVATATLLLGLVVVLPLADAYSYKHSVCNALEDSLVQGQQTAERLPVFEKRTEESVSKLSELEAREVSNGQVGEYRSKLIELARESGCQVRKIEVGQVAARTWQNGGDVLDSQAIVKKNLRPTPFELERRSVLLTVDAEMTSVRQLLEQLQEQNSLAHPRRLELRGTGRNGEQVSLEIELWLFNLTRRKA